MIKQSNNEPYSQRQLRVGELIKQSLGQLFLRDEAKASFRADGTSVVADEKWHFRSCSGCF